MSGGKDGGSTTAVPTTTDNSVEMMSMMMEMMDSMYASVGDLEYPEMEDAADTPVVETVASVDWGDKMDSLKAMTTAEYSVEAANRKGRSSTVHTSPLLDTEDEEDEDILGATGNTD